jgi:hypothetical protein
VEDIRDPSPLVRMGGGDVHEGMQKISPSNFFPLPGLRGAMSLVALNFTPTFVCFLFLLLFAQKHYIVSRRVGCRLRRISDIVNSTLAMNLEIKFRRKSGSNPPAQELIQLVYTEAKPTRGSKGELMAAGEMRGPG